MLYGNTMGWTSNVQAVPSQTANTVSATGTPTAGGGAGAGFGAAIIAQGLVSAIQAIYAGKVMKAQADYNRMILEGKARIAEFNKEITGEQYSKLRGRMISKTMVATAGAGLMPSGSPMAVLQNTLKEINIDQAISNFNIDNEKQYALNEARMQGIQGQMAAQNARVNAFSSILNTASDYGLYKTGGFDLSSGARRAGRG